MPEQSAPISAYKPRCARTTAMSLQVRHRWGRFKPYNRETHSAALVKRGELVGPPKVRWCLRCGLEQVVGI